MVCLSSLRLSPRGSSAGNITWRNRSADQEFTAFTNCRSEFLRPWLKVLVNEKPAGCLLQGMNFSIQPSFQQSGTIEGVCGLTGSLISSSIYPLLRL
jgi:hypothetical protein